jgi:hypothetical protein
MTSLKRLFRRLARNEHGTYAMEFAIISLPLFTLLMSSVELGYMAYSRSKVEGALREVARLAATGSYTAEELDEKFLASIDSIIDVEANITRKSYQDFEDVGDPEPLTSDVAPLGGTPSTGDCYLDINGNNAWDDDMGSDGLGESGDVLYYGVSVRYPLLFKLSAHVVNGGVTTEQIVANAVIKNEPFGNEEVEDPETKCIA